ncbi:MAG: hypothetical protein AAB966_00300, partial [Patescibacteria group bacterium]
TFREILEKSTFREILEKSTFREILEKSILFMQINHEKSMYLKLFCVYAGVGTSFFVNNATLKFLEERSKGTSFPKSFSASLLRGLETSVLWPSNFLTLFN